MRNGAALLLVALLFRVFAGETINGVAGMLALIGVVMLIVGLLRPAQR
jgi:hypothetical protein